MSEMIAKTTFSSDTQAKEYIYACEAAFRARIDHIADCILAQKNYFLSSIFFILICMSSRSLRLIESKSPIIATIES